MRSHFKNSLLIALLLLIVFSLAECGPSGKQDEGSVTIEDSTYRNLSSEVKYVGINTCRQCHNDKYESFVETGMGKSFEKASKNKSAAGSGPHTVVYDKYSDLSYLPFWEGDSMKILEFRLEGKDTVHKRVETINYIIGSGQHTNSHLMNTNGYIHQMPMTFYAQDKKWDLPPGFENGYNSRFSRKIGLECMTCHNALPEFVSGSENKFSKVPAGIDCERCHGPGEIHVKEKSAGLFVDTSKYIDYSIVNPAKLSVELQFDVCQRCHLQGNAVLKEGKSFFDFKPGMKLSDVETIFLPKYEGADDEFIMASHADRLKMSLCFMKANKNDERNTLRPHKNGLTCITCHNPHVSVKATGQESFNNACKNCHTSTLSEKGNSHAVGVRSCTEKQDLRAMKQDNCVSCHMPRSGSIDIPHVTVTDHFIRKPVNRSNIAGLKKFIGLVAINEKNPSPRVKAEAYLNQYEKFDKGIFLLDSAMKYIPDHKQSGFTPHDFELMVRLHYLRNDHQRIYTLDKETESLKDKYKDSWTLYRLGEAYNILGKGKEAFNFYKEAVKLSPFNFEFLNKLAGSYYNQNNFGEAKKIYENILKENPKFAPAWCNLGVMYLQANDLKRAMEHYDRAIALDPDYELALINKAGILIFEKKKEEARVIVKRILKKNPKSEQALSMQKHVM